MRTTPWMTLATGAVLALSLVACGGGDAEEANPAEALSEAMGPVREAEAALTEARAELEGMRTRIADYEAMAAGDRTEELTASYEADTAGLAEAEAEVDTRIPALQEAMVDALNLALNDFPKAPETKELLDIYTREALILSHSYIDEDARYDKAIDNLRNVKNYWDHVELPVPDELKAQIARYNEAQFLSREAYDQVENGMSKDEVLAITGPVSERNHRKDEAKKISYFVYKTKEGPIPAIYFNEKDKVYNKQWDAFGNANEEGAAN